MLFRSPVPLACTRNAGPVLRVAEIEIAEVVTNVVFTNVAPLNAETVPLMVKLPLMRVLPVTMGADSVATAMFPVPF